MILASGNLTNIGHKQVARTSHWTLPFGNLCPLKDSMNKPLHLDFERPCSTHCQ